MTSQSGVLSIFGVSVVGVEAVVAASVVVVSWNRIVRCINDDFDVVVTTDDVEKAEQLLLTADRKMVIATVLVFMIDGCFCMMVKIVGWP